MTDSYMTLLDKVAWVGCYTPAEYFLKEKSQLVKKLVPSHSEHTFLKWDTSCIWEHNTQSQTERRDRFILIIVQGDVQSYKSENRKMKIEIHERKEWVRMVDTAVSREEHFHDPFDADTRLPATKEKKCDSSPFFHSASLLGGATISGVSFLLQHGTMKTLFFASLLRFASAESADGNVTMCNLHNWLPNYSNCSSNGHPNIAVCDTSPLHSTVTYLFICEGFIFPSNGMTFPSNGMTKTYATTKILEILFSTTEHQLLKTNGAVVGQDGYGDCRLIVILLSQCFQTGLERNVDDTIATNMYCTQHCTTADKDEIYAFTTATESQLALLKHEEIMLIKSCLGELLDKLDIHTNKCGICTRRSDSFNSYQSVECLRDVSVEGCSMPKKIMPWKIIHSQYQGSGEFLSQSLNSRNIQSQWLLLEENCYRNRFHIATEAENVSNNHATVNYPTDRSPEEDISWPSVILCACISGFILVYFYNKNDLNCVIIAVWILCTLYATCTSDLVLLLCKEILRLMQFLMNTYNNNITRSRSDDKLHMPTGEEQRDASNVPFSIQEHCFEEHSSDARVMEAAADCLCRKLKLRSDDEDIHPGASPSPNNAEQDVKEYQSLQGKPPVHNKDIEYERKHQQHQQLVDDVYGTEAEVTCTADVQLPISDNFDIVQIRVDRKPYIPSKDEEMVFEATILQASIRQAANDEELESLEIEAAQKKDYDELDHGLFDGQDGWVNSTASHNDEHDGDIHEDITDLYDRPDEVEIRDTNRTSNSENDTHYVTEIGKDTAGELDISVLIPDAKLGASRPLTNEELNITEVYNSKPSKPMQKMSMLRVKVIPPQHFTRQSDVMSIRNQALSKSLIRKPDNDTFMNLKYKVKVGSYKPVDCTVEEDELDTIAALRNCTWLRLNELPVPKIEITVAHVPQFEPLMAIINQISNGTPPTPHVSMRYELLRFCTLRSYPKDDKPFVIQLSAAGFYYASDGDGVVCYSCGVRRYNWTAEDNPMKIHKRINPNCKFLIKNEEVNIPVQYYGAFSKSLMYIDNIPEPIERQELSEDVDNDWAPERIRSPAPRPQNRQTEAATNSLGISTGIPKHSQYATKTAREASYNGWPDSASHTPQELADSGYYYAGFGDCVRCFYCGIGLRHWTKEDNPWIEHARWSHNCVFLKQKKGEEFVNLVQMAIQYSKDNEEQSNASAGNQLPAQEIDKILLSDAAQSVLEMGYQSRIIKNAIEKILRQNGRSKITAQMLMEKVLEIEETENLTNTATASAVSPPITSAPQSAKAEAQSAKAVESKPVTGGQSAAETDKVKKDAESTKSLAAENNKVKKDEEGAKSSLNNSSKEKNNNCKAASKELSDEAKLQDPKSIKAENEELKEQTLCKVCLDNTVCIVFLPCGHLVTCADCAPAMRKCPICRALVKGTVRTYMS